MKIYQSIKSGNYITILGCTVLLTLACLSTAQAQQRPVDSDKVGDKQCSKVRKNGSIHSGKCKNVCKGKTIHKDYTREYGNRYYCKEARRPTSSTIRVIRNPNATMKLR